MAGGIPQHDFPAYTLVATASDPGGPVQDAYNTEDWDAYRQAMCSAMREQFTGGVMESVQKTRTDYAPTDVTVTAVAIESGTATATLDANNEALGHHIITLPMERANRWKVCQVS